MDAQGNIPLGTKPSVFRITADNFDLKLSTTKNYITPLKVDPSMNHDDLLEAIDWHFRTKRQFNNLYNEEHLNKNTPVSDLLNVVQSKRTNFRVVICRT